MNQEKNTLAYLIALVLKLDYKEVYDSLIFVNNKLDRQKYKDSGKTVDFVCRLNGKIIGIEMNNNSSKESLERNISYAADLFKSKMESGHKYEYELVIQININNFTFQGNDKIMEEYSLRNEEGEALTEKLRLSQLYTAKEEGIEQGSIKERHEIAKNMLKDKVDISTISRYTGLSKEQIEKLSKK